MTRNERIGMILDDSFPPDPRVENESACLINQGYSVFLLVLGVKQEHTHDLHPQLHVEYIDLPHWVRKKASALAYTLPIYHAVIFRSIRRFILERKIDLIHVHDLRVARAVFWANHKDRLPLILDLHENRPAIMKHYAHVKSFPGNLLISAKRWAKFEVELCNRAAKTIVVTNEAMHTYLSQKNIPREKLHVVANTVDDRFLQRSFQVAESADKVSFIYIGDTSERRGLMDVINAVAILPDEVIKKIEVQILGESSFQPQLQAQVRRFDLEGCVKLLGWVDYDGIHRQLQQSHVGLCPLHRNEHHDTTYANKLFQYMAYGLALLVSDCSAQANLVVEEKCGSVHRAGAVDEIASSITWYSENKAALHLQGRSGFAGLRKKHSLRSVQQSLALLYDSVLNQA